MNKRRARWATAFFLFCKSPGNSIGLAVGSVSYLPDGKPGENWLPGLPGAGVGFDLFISWARILASIWCFLALYSGFSQRFFVK